jgi:hypothetical protein
MRPPPGFSRWYKTPVLGCGGAAALLPIATLYIGKLIVDETVRLVGGYP